MRMGVITGNLAGSRQSSSISPASLVIGQLTNRIVHANDAALAMLGSPLHEIIGLDIREFFPVEIPPSGTFASNARHGRQSGNWINTARARFSTKSNKYELQWRPIQIGWMSYWLVTCKEEQIDVKDTVNERLFDGVESDLIRSFRLPDPRAVDETHWKHISFHKPANVAGGDILVIEEISRDHLFYFIGDVAGHHGSADMVRMMLMSYLRAFSSELGPVDPNKFPGRLLNKLNKALCCDEKNDSLLTGLVLLLEKTGRRGWYASAGHQPMYLVEPGIGNTEISTPDIPLGINPKARYSTMELLFTPGDRIVCYTDGLISPGPSTGFTDGRNSLHEIVRACGISSADRLAGSLENLWHSMSGDRTSHKTDITFTVINLDGENRSRAIRAAN